MNLGKSKITELEDAPKDYQESFKLLRPFGDYFVINVSSPNTPGLRTLQEKGPLTEIISAIQEIDSDKPLFVKVAPDLEISALDEVIHVAHEKKLTGLIATNTTISRASLPAGLKHAEETGGLSGAPLKKMSDDFLKHIYKSADKTMILMGVGGIMTGQDVFDKIAFGAHLTQVYTGWIYGGPHMVPNVMEDFVGLLVKEEVKSLSELRGTRA